MLTNMTLHLLLNLLIAGFIAIVLRFDITGNPQKPEKRITHVIR